MRELVFGENLYAVLGIESLGMAASEAQIRKAYRKKALKHHPDKKKKTEEEPPAEEAKVAKEIDPVWLKLQTAYETLMDKNKRMRYDSTLDFDESIPDA